MIRLHRCWWLMLVTDVGDWCCYIDVGDWIYWNCHQHYAKSNQHNYYVSLPTFFDFSFHTLYIYFTIHSFASGLNIKRNFFQKFFSKIFSATFFSNKLKQKTFIGIILFWQRWKCPNYWKSESHILSIFTRSTNLESVTMEILESKTMLKMDLVKNSIKSVRILGIWEDQPDPPPDGRLTEETKPGPGILPTESSS